MKLILCIVFLLIGYGNELSLHKISDESPEIVFQVSTRKSFCFPTEELMRVFDNEANNHNWGYSVDLFEYSSAVRRVGQVLCRQLGFSVLESISPVRVLSNHSQHILWAASCLGYEPLLSHCYYQEMEDPSSHPCKSLIGLKCVNCHKKIVMKLDEPQEIFSPGFPASYLDNTICEWRFTVDKVENFKLFTVKLEHMSLPRTNYEGNCVIGYLGIYGYSRNNQFCLREKIICGFSAYREFSLNCSVVILRWNAGIFHPRPHLGTPWGFKLKIEAVSAEKKPLVVDSNLRSGSIAIGNVIGIVLGVLSIIVIIVSGYFGCRFVIRKRAETRRRHSMAERIDSRRNNPSGNCVTIHPPVKLQLVLNNNNNNNVDINNASNTDGNIPRASVSSGVYEEWNDDQFRFNRSFDKEAYLMLEEALRRSTLSPKYFGTDNSEAKKGSMEQKFQFPIPVVKITAATQISSFLKGTNSSTSDVSSFTGSIGSNNVFSEDAHCQVEHQYKNADSRRKSTYTVVHNVSSIEAGSENIDIHNSEQVAEFSNEKKSSVVEEFDFIGRNVCKTLSKRFSTGHFSGI